MSSNSLLNARYSVSKTIGSGNFGEVLLGRDNVTNTDIVVKRSRATLSNAECLAAVQEASTLASLDYPFIVRCLDSWVHTNKLHIVMEYCSHGDLQRVIRHHAATKTPIPETRIWHYTTQLLLSLNFIHNRNIIHRDLKAANVLLDKDSIVKLADFGLCKTLPSTLDFARSKVGTPTAVAPEVLADNAIYNTRVDIWALGVLMYELITLRRPFDGATVPAVLKKILFEEPEAIKSDGMYSPELIATCLAMLNKNPKVRPSARALLSTPWVEVEVRSLSVSHGTTVSALMGKEKESSSEREVEAWDRVCYRAVHEESSVLRMSFRKIAVNVRATHSLTGEKLDALKHGDIMECTARLEVEKVTWLAVTLQRGEGVVVSGFCWAHVPQTREEIFSKVSEVLVTRPSKSVILLG